mmetsp:Transcript_31921/g.81379  ORF Transcript_31921/g.81379 Transcript_31921/m.81379 type:complete len:226 (+) Transcript_31921:39-716(+)
MKHRAQRCPPWPSSPNYTGPLLRGRRLHQDGPCVVHGHPPAAVGLLRVDVHGGRLALAWLHLLDASHEAEAALDRALHGRRAYADLRACAEYGAPRGHDLRLAVDRGVARVRARDHAFGRPQRLHRLQVGLAEAAVELVVGLQHGELGVDAERGELVPQPRRLLVPLRLHGEAQERLEVLRSGQRAGGRLLLTAPQQRTSRKGARRSGEAFRRQSQQREHDQATS